MNASTLATIRERLGLTQAELATRIGVARSYVGMLEVGSVGLPVSRAILILRELGIHDVADVLEALFPFSADAADKVSQKVQKVRSNAIVATD